MLTSWTDKELVSSVFCLFVVCLFDDLDQVEADHVIKRLTELAPSALLGEQHFFMGWGLHRFGFDSLQR